MDTPTYFSLTPSSQIGDVYATEFKISAEFPLQYNQTTWDLGDGTFVYDQREIKHIYQYPGIYKVSLSAWNDLGFLLRDTADISVDYVHRDLVVFKDIPDEYGTPGLKSITPFVVSLTSSKIDQDIAISLQTFNTQSVPHYALPDKWKFITPTWRFIDAETEEIIGDSYKIDTKPIYRNSKVVAVSGEFSFYYVDDLSTGTNLTDNCPLLLSMTLSTENFTYPPESLVYPYHSYSNSEVARAVIAWQVSDVVPTRLIVTENYLNDIYPIKWKGVPIPIMITCEFDPLMIDEFAETIAISATKALAYPRTNELGAFHSVNIALSSSKSYPPSAYRIDEPGLYFQAFDKENNTTSGYLFTTITPLVTTTVDLFDKKQTLCVTASTIAMNQIPEDGVFNFPFGYPIYPFAYVAHPFASVINKVNIVTYPSFCENINYYKDLGVLVEGIVKTTKVPSSSASDTTNYNLSGTAAIYGMAFNPVKNRLYAADADLDRLYVYHRGQTLLRTVDLSGITGSDYNTPAYITTDSEYNVWVSLYDSQTFLKFDSNLDFLLSACPSVSIPLSSINENEFGGIGEHLISPPIVETDMKDNIWTCFSHILSSKLVKFNKNGTELFSVSSLSPSSCPIAISVDPYNNIWVACKQSGTIEYYTSEGQFVKRIENITKPSYMSLDRRGNIWFTHAYNHCSFYDVRTEQMSSWKFDGFQQEVTSVDNVLTPEDILRATYENEIWGGLEVDVFNRVWAIDSENNKLFVFNNNAPEEARYFTIYPRSHTNYIIRSGEPFVRDIYTEYIRSAQAAGDWTGNRWYQKYAGKYNELEIYGTSTPFSVYDLENSYKITKNNEEFNTAAYYESLALPDILKQNKELFEEFLVAILGDGNPSKESIGRVTYERIANFLNAHGNFETAEIPQLISFAQQLSVKCNSFGTDFPVEINRLLNLFSTPKHLLRGIPNMQSNFQDTIGDPILPTDYITDGQYIYLKDKQFQDYKLVLIKSLIDDQNLQHTSYMLSSLSIDSLRQPITENYYAFKHIHTLNGYINNIINWDSDNTTITYNLSTEEQWYGEDGIIEVMFNNLLTKNLFSTT